MLFPPFSLPTQRRRRLLYVGGDLHILQSLKVELSDEGWFVVRSPGDSLAVVLVESEIHYDLLMFDNELTGTTGMELVRLARSVEHRRQTPIILLSFTDCGIAARRAGADMCLRKPDHLYALAETVRDVSSKFKVQGSRFEG